MPPKPTSSDVKACIVLSVSCFGVSVFVNNNVMYLPETVYNFVLWVKIHLLKESKKMKIYTSKQK